MAQQGKSSNEEVSFADVIFEKRYRKAQNEFLNQVDMLIDR
ncbi:IS5/IS1182 family transposase, partial [Prevotella sp. OH937_COT-195]